jgi:peptidoglycan/LPS O-acetylase OafA/YrhL/lysophospholipase L1-like esterase
MSTQNDHHNEQSGTPAWGTRRGPVVPYVPALDGLRALAVLAVVVYHANHQWLGGGFLGVEVFFVISGYLITLLLIAERERSGTVSLGNFWLRRARRLLPALFTLLLGTTMYCALFDRDRLGMLRGDVVSGFLYVSNWFQIWSGSSYTSAFSFAPLRHLWSLAVEEQYYIVWPLIMFVLLRRIRPKTLPILGLVFTSVAVAIAVATAMIYHAGPIDTFANTPQQFMTLFGHRVGRIDFLYLGTITRASGLLLGAALATMWRPWALRRGRAGSNANGLDIAGVLALLALGAMCWKFREVVEVTDVGVSGYDLLYRGGFIAVGIATVVAIATVTHPRSRLGKYVIGTPLLVWIGKRSYGLYLYHWTVFQAYRKAAGNSLNLREFVALMAITAVLTEVSYRWIETPIRNGKALAFYREWRIRNGTFRGPFGAAIAVLAAAPVFSVVSMVGARVIPDDITAGLDANEEAVTSITTTTVAVGATTVPAVATTAPTPSGKMKVFAVGDSVMLGSAKKLTSYGITVDASKNRQVLGALQIFNYYKSVNELGNVVVIHLGTNGITKASTFERILKPLKDVDRVIVLTMRVPRHASEKINNKIINNLPATHPNVTILDWYTLSKPHPEWFNSDGIHPNALGQDNYVALIVKAAGL